VVNVVNVFNIPRFPQVPPGSPRFPKFPQHLEAHVPSLGVLCFCVFIPRRIFGHFIKFNGSKRRGQGGFVVEDGRVLAKVGGEWVGVGVFYWFAVLLGCALRAMFGFLRSLWFCGSLRVCRLCYSCILGLCIGVVVWVI